ncbi:PREDICTED: uncharacterized protein LOC105567920 isoform X4 [Vollenhovia emeryi]|uniref:uncharacterized protein LOC105567920 isoform X4 n=1 Tax=Vollenhovia emeryi TaxID=411798 RepID=UPI0005F549CB|nr:PREDICTED: uncharacterized protein LOC105567920 isoform X4 [Vollenhovia emeryi]
MDTSSDIFQSRLYRLNRTLLSLLGQWPFQKDRYRRVIIVTTSFIGLTQALTQVLALVTLRGDFDALIECAPPLIVDGVCIIKLTTLICNVEKLKMLLVHIQRDWRSWTIKSEFEILSRFAESGRSITIGYASGMYAFGSLFPLLAIIPKIIGKNVTSDYATRPVGFPYHVEYYIDLEKYYYPVLIHNYLTTAIRLTTIVAFDTYVAILVQHCCALFSVVRYRLEYIRKSIEQDKELTLLQEDDKFYKNFVYCIQKHKDALRLIRKVLRHGLHESVFHRSWFCYFGYESIGSPGNQWYFESTPRSTARRVYYRSITALIHSVLVGATNDRSQQSRVHIDLPRRMV